MFEYTPRQLARGCFQTPNPKNILIGWLSSSLLLNIYGGGWPKIWQRVFILKRIIEISGGEMVYHTTGCLITPGSHYG